MPDPQNTLLIEGSFKELSEELASYLEGINKSGDESSPLRTELAPLLEKLTAAEEAQDSDAQDALKDQVLKPLVAASSALSAAPEKEYISAYNLLIHLINQSPNINQHLPRVCHNLLSEVGSVANTKVSMVLSVLSTIFNILEPDDGTRLRVLKVVLDVVEKTSNFEVLEPQLKHLDKWLVQWETEPDEQRELYLAVSRTAQAAGEDEQSYEFLVRALRTIPSNDTSSSQARELSVKALKQALNSPSHFDFEDLSSLDSVQALRSSDAELYALLDIFTADQLEDYSDFCEEHPGWVAANELDEAALERKMRLLTLASLAAGTGQTRSLPYERIAQHLKVPLTDVEMWVIDVIRAGLVEGKLSQLNQTFLIHRSTYRVFGENQWREVASRLDMWRASLLGVLGVIRHEKESYLVQKEQEARALEAKVNGAGERSGGFRKGNRDRDAIDVGMD